MFVLGDLSASVGKPFDALILAPYRDRWPRSESWQIEITGAITRSACLLLRHRAT